MVEPFYAMKCNPDPVIDRLLATLGCGFDCATMGEINLLLNGKDFSTNRLHWVSRFDLSLSRTLHIDGILHSIKP